MKIFEIIPIFVYASVGIISLFMAFKSLSYKKFILFHEKAAAVSLEKLDKSLQSVIIAIMQVSGLGFLTTALLLLIFPMVNYFIRNEFIKYSIPIIALVFCTGLFLVNYNLHKKTKSATPWIGSLVAIFSIIIGLIISFLA
jgi:hypothetical protein